MMQWKALLIPVVIVSLAGCDNFQTAHLTNGCEVTLEVAMAPGGPSGDKLDVGETTELNSSGGTFDIVVRVQGSTTWPVRISWDRIEKATDEDGVPFVISGEDCPAP